MEERFCQPFSESSSTKPLPQLSLSVCVSKGGAALARKGKQHIRHKEEDEEEEDERSEIVGGKRDGIDRKRK